MIMKTTVHAFQLRMSNHRVKKKIKENIEEEKRKKSIGGVKSRQILTKISKRIGNLE